MIDFSIVLIMTVDIFIVFIKIFIVCPFYPFSPRSGGGSFVLEYIL